MRESFGGVFMIRLLLVFIVIYVSFTAVSLNYAKAFRVKNKVIDYIETNDIVSLDSSTIKNACAENSELMKILTKAKYAKECRNGNGTFKNAEGKNDAFCCNGVIIELSSQTDRVVTYDIKTYADWNLGALNMILGLAGKDQNSEAIVDGTWEITGQAKVTLRKKGE